MNRETLHEAREHARRSLVGGAGGASVSQGFAAAVEEMVRAAAPSQGVSVLAQGGLGRRELVPFADVDLVFVTDEDPGVVEPCLRALWDAGLQLGYAVVTRHEASARAADDHHAATALLEARAIAGDIEAGQRVIADHAQWIHKRRDEFVATKLGELSARRQRFGDAVYLVEPNVKSSPGGLRDVHSLVWVGRALAGVNAEASLSGLHAHGFVNDRELDDLQRGVDELLRVRSALHLISRRAEDRLLFMHQAEVAALMGFEAVGELAGYDGLMRSYFESALSIRRTVDDAVERITIAPGETTPTRHLSDGLCARGPYVFPEDPAWFDDGIARVLDAYRVAAEHGLALSPRARQRVYRVASAPDWDEPGVGRALLRLCRSDEGQGRPFTALLECGALAAAMRDIARLKARFKHDGYHVYTTDAHIARTCDLAWRTSVGAEPPPPPLEAAFERTDRRHLFVLGALFHDIGKGLPGDHSLTGADIADRETARMGLPEDEREIVRFIVEKHLVLSRASQRRDLADPTVIKELAEEVETLERLDLLALVTWVDIASVAPEMFTDWKARLLALAIERVRAYLLDPEAGGAIRGRREENVRERVRVLVADEVGDEVADRFVSGASARTLGRRMSGAIVEDARAYAHYSGSPLVVSRPAAGGHAHHLRVVAPDRVGLFADLAAAIADVGANLLHAHSGSRDDGVALDAFRIDDGEGEALDDERLQALVHALEVAASKGARRIPSRPPTPPPGFRTQVRFKDDADSLNAIVIEVRAPDRTGLAADIARQIADAGYSIELAKLDTEGPAARDTFYVEAGERANRAALEAGVNEAVRGQT